MNPHEHSKRHGLHRIIDSIIAFSAGAIGMLVQLVWVRALVQWYGTSAITIATALAASLAGLAIGAYCFRQTASEPPWWQRLTGNQPAAYLLLTAALGILVGWVLLLNGDRLLGGLAERVSPVVSLFLTASIALIPINMALGGVLPALIESNSAKRNLAAGALYAAETVGGAAGALAAGFWLIQTVGLPWTLFGTGVIGASIGIGAACWSNPNRRFKADSRSNVESNSQPTTEDSGNAATDDSGDAAGDTGIGLLRSWPIAIAILLAGIASMGMEIVWQRLLILIVGTDTLSYTVVVVTYLFGIAVGAWCGNAMQKRVQPTSDPSNQFSWLQIFVAMSSAMALSAFCYLASGTGQQWLRSASSEAAITWQRFAICFGVLALPSCLIGASFPAAIYTLMQKGFSQRSATANVYAIGAAGNILGVLLTGFVLIPAFGLQTSLATLAGGAMAAAAIAAQRWNSGLVLASCVAAGVGTFAVMNQQPIGLSNLPGNQKIAFYREGPVNTVAVIEDRENDTKLPVVQQMVVDGVVIGENFGGVDEKQQLLAHLPILIRSMSTNAAPKKLNTLTIGLGTGILAGELAKHSSVDHATCIELSPAVIQASELFSADNHNVSSNAKASIIQGDGIHFLRQTDDSFDCIISDGKSRPGHAGNVAFFSTDYYQLANRRLTESGTFVQWISLDAPKAELEVVLKSFAQCFGSGKFAIAAPDSIYLVASRVPIRWSDEKLDDYLDAATTLHPYHWRFADDIKSMAWLNAHDVAARLKDTPANSLSHPVLEKYALHGSNDAPNTSKIQNLTWLHSLLLDEKITTIQTATEGTANAADPGRDACAKLIAANIVELKGDKHWLDVASSHYQLAVDALPKLTRGSRLANKLLATALAPVDSALGSAAADRYTKLLGIAARIGHNDFLVQMEAGQRLLDVKATEAATPRFYRATKLAPQDWRTHLGFARCLIRLNKHAAAIRPLQRAVQLEPNQAITHRLLAHVAKVIGNDRLARKHASLAAELGSAAGQQ